MDRSVRDTSRNELTRYSRQVVQICDIDEPRPLLPHQHHRLLLSQTCTGQSQDVEISFFTKSQTLLSKFRNRQRVYHPRIERQRPLLSIVEGIRGHWVGTTGARSVVGEPVE